MRIPPDIRAWITVILASILAFVISVALISATQTYTQKQRTAAILNPVRLIGAGGFSTYIAVQSVDLKNRVMIATIRSPAAGEDIDIKLKIPNGLIVERQDAVIKDNMIVGRTPLRAASTTDITLGTRGYGYMRYEADGSMYLGYILIGSPFPRP